MKTIGIIGGMSPESAVVMYVGTIKNITAMDFYFKNGSKNYHLTHISNIEEKIGNER